MPGRRRRVDEIPRDQAAVVGANIRALRQQRGWNQAKLGDLMGWASNSTVCAAEGHRNDRQRGFTTQEVGRLAAIFGVSPSQLTTQCANCGGHPPTGVRLPDLRSPAPDMKPQFTGATQTTAGRSRRSPKCFGKATLPLTSKTFFIAVTDRMSALR